MNSLITVLKRILSVFRRDRYFEDLQQEMDFHVATRAEKHIAGGMSPSEAVKAAEKEFGNGLRFREQSWNQWAFTWQDELFQDIRYAARVLVQNRGWTAIAALSLALGIGANTAIFSVFDALILKSLPVQDPEGLIALTGQYHYPFFQQLRQADILPGVFASSGINEQDLETDGAQAERIPISLVSGEYFSVLGVNAAAGRVFTPDDDRDPGAEPVAVLSYGYWQRRFARSPDVVGKAIRIGGTPATIIGVAMSGFFGERVGPSPDLWLPLTAWPRVIPGRNLLQSPGTAWLDIIGRRRQDVAIAATEAELTARFRRFLTDSFGPSAAEDDRQAIAKATVRLAPADKGLSRLREQFSHPLYILFALVALMLLIACANVANMLLARAAARKREIGLRLALGVSRSRLIRQLLTENLLLSALSSIFGLAIAVWGRQYLVRLASPNGMPVSLDAAIDARVLIFVVALSLATALLFGLAPVWQSARLDLVASLRGTPETQSNRSRIGASLVSGQVALALVLLMGAGLFLQTLINLRNVNLGFEAGQLSIVDLNPVAAGYEGRRYAAYAEQLLQTFATLPGVAAATFSENGALMGRDSGTNRMRPDDFVAGPEGIPHTDFDVVGPQYFSTMGISLLAGRDINRADDVSSERVLVINQTMARLFFPGLNPVGRRMLWQFGESQSDFKIVGVAADMKQNAVRGEAGPRFYIPYFQLEISRPTWRLASIRFLLRSAGATTVNEPLREAIRSVDARVPVLGIHTVPALVERTLLRERMVATLSTLFAAVALALTCVGLYGLMSYRVARRTNEIGIRMAIGSTARDVIGTVMREALRMVAAGLLAGVVGVSAMSRLVGSMLYGVTPFDSTTIFTVVAAMVLVAAAAFLPARRASRVDPLIALRNE